MAISDAVQTLTAAFSFGILFQAASGVLLFFVKGHGATLFQDGRRLVLVLFLFFAALWAQIDFLNLLIPLKSATACQATVVFSSASDQLARVGMEQFLLWSVGDGSKVTTEQLTMQAVLGIRLIAGGLLVGFTRPEFAPACVARTSLLPISIVVLTLDFIIIGVLAVRALSFGMFRALREAQSSAHRGKSRGLVLTLVGYSVWTGMSAAMLLGIPKTVLILRTTLPSTGLLILIGIIAISPSALLLPAEEQSTTPEATSPFVTPAAASREISRFDIGNGSPISSHTYTKSGSLFVVNPSAATRVSSTTLFQNNIVHSKGFTKLGEGLTVRALGPSEQGQVPKNGPGYRGSSGIFPSMIGVSSTNPGSYAPHIRPASEHTRHLPAISLSQQGLSSPQPKKSLFNWSKPAPQPGVRSLGISKPLMNASQQSPSHPFARMQTIDLATAAANERERREGAAARSRLVPDRSAPRPSTIAPQEALRRSISVKRKGIPMQPPGPMPTIPSSGSSGLSVDAINGNTTSASLSPGREDIRRRSPRNGTNFDGYVLERSVARPSLQRNQSIGLPSNPRSQGFTMARETNKTAEQTVMFTNDIVYDDPGMVKTIISGAPEMYEYSKRMKTSEHSPIVSDETTLKSSNSIIHRPRPYRRDSEKNRAFFPSEPSPGHRRSKSSSSLVIRKSILRSYPGSPTQLPPLPAPPTSAAKLKRLLPNDTKSMTFDEKIEFLFPAPPGATIVHRRSSVPSLPRVPSVFMSDTPSAQSPTDEGQQSRRASKRTTIASFGLQDFQLPEDLSKDMHDPNPARQIYRLSANKERSLADELGETWIPGISSADTNIPKPFLQARPPRDAGSYNKGKSALNVTTSSVESSTEDCLTDWGSIHSKVPAVDLSKARRNAQSTSTFILPSTTFSALALELPGPQIDYNDEEEDRTVILDPEDVTELKSVTDRRSFFLEANQSLPGDATPKLHSGTAWHRRIGDDLPTFSERKMSVRSRKMPPPTPLLLNSRLRNAGVVFRAREPSPVDSPERAIKEIQAQLKRFEEPNSRSVSSLMRHIPDIATINSDRQYNGDQFKLLENLEKEMGQQENQWQQMQCNLDRDSMSGTISPPALDSGSSPASSQSSSRTPPRITSQRGRVRSSMTIRSKGHDSSSTISTQSSDNSRASVWQRRLAEAQMEYLENAPALLRKSSVNYLLLSKAHIGSPTPPESVESGDSEAGSDPESEPSNLYGPTHHHSPPSSLWQLPLISPKAATGRMWNPPYEATALAISSEPPAKDIRASQRSVFPTLPIVSRSLWEKPILPATNRPLVGLWGSKIARPESIITRRVTQRPQRKSRRLTFLPDIVESPQPIPNKRDTLGIFQFPWGETSDSAIYQPAFNPFVLADRIPHAKPNARSRELELESTEYSSSFFDDYDEEEPDEGSDDDFDETTLWEIASLLKSNDVPSKNSLLPLTNEIIEDYDEDTDFESESEDQSPTNPKTITAQLNIQPLATIPKVESKLWVSSLAPALAVAPGLPQPDVHTWKAYAPEQTDAVRFKPVPSIGTSVLQTSDLWISRKAGSTVGVTGLLWDPAPAAEDAPTMPLPVALPPAVSLMQLPQPLKSTDPKIFAVDTTQPVVCSTTVTPAVEDISKTSLLHTDDVLALSSLAVWTVERKEKQAAEWTSGPVAFPPAFLWAPRKTIESNPAVGLFTKSVQKSSYRTCNYSPAAKNIVRKPRENKAPLYQLTSSELWGGPEIMQSVRHWISESSVRPETPSYSDTSSGQSSPASEASSVNSNSTETSYFWGSARSAAAAAWWDSKSAKQSSPLSPDDGLKFSHKLPASTPLPAAKESEVLASRELWEAIAPSSKEHPERKYQKSAQLETSSQTLIRPTRQQHRPPIVYCCDWDETLARAIEAGKPKQCRPAADTVDWESALSAAISQSLCGLQRPKLARETWHAALNDALPKTLVSGLCDTALWHPEFVAEALVSGMEDIYPTVPEHDARLCAQSQHMCNETIVDSNLSTSSSLWSKSSVSQQGLNAQLLPKENTKKRLPRRLEGLPILQSATLWQNPLPVPKKRSWLLTPLVAPAQMWALRPISSLNAIWAAALATSASTPDHFASINSNHIGQPSPSRLAALPRLNSDKTFTSAAVREQETNLVEKAFLEAVPRATAYESIEASFDGEDFPLWSVKIEASLSSSDMFSHVEINHAKNANSEALAELQMLDSNQLVNFINRSEADTDWHRSSPLAICANPGMASQTWAAPSVVMSTNRRSWLWGNTQESSPALFSNPHSEPWDRKRRELTSVREIKSTTMWRRDTTLPESPVNWLMKRSASRVEFRY